MNTNRPTVLRIGKCTREEAGELLADHYAPGSPTRVCALLGARLEIAGAARLVGVLAVTYPTLNDRWREQAWPGVYEISDKRERAKKLNATLRRIARVVVIPQQRGRGIATALVRAYLRRPLTERTEAVAAMGDFCGCFASAGMRAIECAPSERDVKLARALREMRIRPERLADDRAVEKLAANEKFLRAIRAWANSAGATRKWLERADAIQMLAPMAARGVVEKKRVVWVAERGVEVSRCRGGEGKDEGGSGGVAKGQSGGGKKGVKVSRCQGGEGKDEDGSGGVAKGHSGRGKKGVEVSRCQGAEGKDEGGSGGVAKGQSGRGKKGVKVSRCQGGEGKDEGGSGGMAKGQSGRRERGVKVSRCQSAEGDAKERQEQPPPSSLRDESSQIFKVRGIALCVRHFVPGSSGHANAIPGAGEFFANQLADA